MFPRLGRVRLRISQETWDEWSEPSVPFRGRLQASPNDRQPHGYPFRMRQCKPIWDTFRSAGWLLSRLRLNAIGCNNRLWIDPKGRKRSRTEKLASVREAELTATEQCETSRQRKVATTSSISAKRPRAGCFGYYHTNEPVTIPTQQGPDPNQKCSYFKAYRS